MTNIQEFASINNNISKKSISKLFFTFKNKDIIPIEEEYMEERTATHGTNDIKLTCFYKGCDKTFSTRAALDAHEYLHLTEKRYKCDISNCNKVFPNLCRLNLHKRIHTGEKPFKCLICKKSFNEKGNLKTHMRIHTGEKPYVCNFKGCTQSFRALGHLKDHEKKHFGIKPFECNVCKAKFARSSTLKIHIRTHSIEKLHQCPVIDCAKRFREKGNMKNHYKLHLIKTNIFNIEEMKIERIHEFTVNFQVLKEDKSEVNKTRNIQQNMIPNWNVHNLGEVLENESLFNSIMVNPVYHHLNKTNFIKYLQNHFDMKEIYHIFKPSG